MSFRESLIIRFALLVAALIGLALWNYYYNQPFPSPRGAVLDFNRTEDVMFVQRKLQSEGYFPHPANGEWDQQTRRALETWKFVNHLPNKRALDQATESFLLEGERP